MNRAESFWINCLRSSTKSPPAAMITGMLDTSSFSNMAEFEANWKEDYPHDVSFYQLTTAEYNGYRNVILNGSVVIRYEPGETGFYDLSKLLLWLIESVENTIFMLREGSYNDHIREALPYRYRTGRCSEGPGDFGRDPDPPAPRPAAPCEGWAGARSA